MNDDKKVLACVDQSKYAESVADYATWAARRMQAPMELLHVIDRHPRLEAVQDHSGAIGLDAQENLLKQLSDEDETRTRAAREVGRVFLNGLRERAMASGAFVVDVRQRHGELDTTLPELQGDVRLFVLGRRGASAQATQRDLGRNLEWVVRSVNKPVLMAGKPQVQRPKQIEEARTVLEAVGFQVSMEIHPGDPETVIAEEMKSRQCDLLVMGAYSHSPWRSLIVGSKTTDLLRSAAVPTLLLR